MNKLKLLLNEEYLRPVRIKNLYYQKGYGGRTLTKHLQPGRKLRWMS